jgi:diguanylate cyclase (GGDEF)-like protein
MIGYPHDSELRAGAPAVPSAPVVRIGRWLLRLIAPQVLFPILAVVVLSVLWWATMRLSRQEQENARRAAWSTSQEMLDTYEAQVVRVLREIDQTLKSLQYAYQLRGNARGAMEDLSARDLLPPDLVFTVSMTSPTGVVVASSSESALASVVDRGLMARSRFSDVMLEGQPVQSGGEWRLRFSRSLLSPDGSFGGVAVVEVDASFFVSGYDAGKLGHGGVLAVLGTDGVFRVRRSGDAVSVGDRVAYETVVMDQGVGATDAVLSLSSWDGVLRYTSARELYDFPLALVVGVAEEEQLAPAARRSLIYVRRAALGSVLLLLGLAVLGWMSWRLEKLRQRERESRVAHAMRVEHLAYHDALTGLPNRSFLTRIIDDRIRQASRYGREFGLLFLDLDGFKQINDTLGHDAGDDLLREVARRLEDTLRRSDTVARMGGDEFMVLLPELESENQAATVARNILAALGEPYVLLGERFSVTVSVGISLYPADGADEQTLMKNADIAMYAAKDAGKNSFRFFSPEMSVASQERINLEASLRQALVKDEFELHYQARRDLQTGTVTGMEALLRWNHPAFGTVAPGKFLPLAEETGLILPIGKWVLRTACLQNMAWRSEGLPSLSVAVNLSPRQFFDASLVHDVTAALQETGMAPELLELEISESILARDTSKSLPVLQQLKLLGVRITVDNFGTGYSALSVLGTLPLDTIKIDRLFMREDSGNTVAPEVIRGILAMARVLSRSVIAHGVETREQVDFLRAQVCDQVQGFYFGRPFRAVDVAAMLSAEDAVLRGARDEPGASGTAHGLAGKRAAPRRAPA